MGNVWQKQHRTYIIIKLLLFYYYYTFLVLTTMLSTFHWNHSPDVIIIHQSDIHIDSQTFWYHSSLHIDNSRNIILHLMMLSKIIRIKLCTNTIDKICGLKWRKIFILQSYYSIVDEYWLKNKDESNLKNKLLFT